MLPNANLYERKANINNISLISLMDDQVMQLKAQGENLLLLFIQAWMKMKTTKYKFVTQKSLCFKSRIYFTNTKL